MAEDIEQLVIRFRGICGHIDLPNGQNGNGGKKKKRTVLVRHRDGTAAIEHHVPYIEFYADDVQTFPPELKVFQYSRPGTDGRFARVNLDDATEIRLRGIRPDYVDEEISYMRAIPRMSEVLKKFTVAKSLTVSDANKVDPGRAVAVFDMPGGRLVAGEPEALITRFPPDVGFKPRRLAQWTDLYTTYTPPLVIELVPLGSDGAGREIVFKETLRMLTIGNEPERLILGVIGQTAAHDHHQGAHRHEEAAPAQPTGHYILYYNLLEDPPPLAERHVPIPTQFEGSGCPNNNYP